MKKLIKIILSVMLGLLVGLLIAEIALRIFYFWQGKKVNNDHRRSIGQWRDTAHLLKKPADTLRIAFIGDSITFGQGVAFQETFATRTGEILREKIRQPRIEILNFGVPAYNVLNNLESLKKNVLPHDPDIIVLGYCINDFNNRWLQAPLIASLKKEGAKYKIFGFLDKYSKLAYFTDWALFQLFSKVKELHLKWMNDSLDPDRNPMYKQMKEGLAELIQLVAQKNGLVLILPILADAHEDQHSYYVKAKDLAVACCQQYHCPYLEIFPHLKFKPPYRWWVNAEEHHPNRNAHELIGRLIAEALLAQEPLLKLKNQ